MKIYNVTFEGEEGQSRSLAARVAKDCMPDFEYLGEETTIREIEPNNIQAMSDMDENNVLMGVQI